MFGTSYFAFDNIASLDFYIGHKVCHNSRFFYSLFFSVCAFLFKMISAVAQSYDQVMPQVIIAEMRQMYNSTVYATGSALTRLAPDRVIISIGVETTDKTANDALSLNSGLMNNIISELRSDGLKPNETRTSFFNIFPLYNYTESGTRLNVSGFTVTNTRAD